MTAERAIVEAIHQRLPTQVVEHVATIDQVRDEAFAPRRVTALPVSSFGALAFLIALVGIAGVLAFTVSLRTAEIGIRMSLGADAARVRAMVLAQGSVLLIAGVVVGIVGAFFSTRLPSTFLFGVSAHDPLTLAVVSLGLLATGLAACWIPARRAALIDPVTALRTD